MPSGDQGTLCPETLQEHHPPAPSALGNREEDALGWGAAPSAQSTTACYQEPSKHMHREGKSLPFLRLFISFFSLFIGFHKTRRASGNPLQFLDKTFKWQNRTEKRSTTKMTPNGNDSQTATIRDQDAGVGKGLVETTEWFDRLNINLREK